MFTSEAVSERLKPLGLFLLWNDGKMEYWIEFDD